jgi:two-component system response regulator PilR (NtrC family)
VRLQGAPELSPREGEAASFPPEGVNLDALIEEFERKWIMGALAATGQNKTKAAGLLGLTFRSFRHRLDKYQIE